MRLKLGATIAIAVVIGLLIPVTVATFFVFEQREKELGERLAADHERLTEILALGMREPLWSFNREGARPLFDSLFRDARVVEAVVRDRKLGAFLQRSHPERRTDRQLTLERNVVYADGGRIGSVAVVMDTGALESRIGADRRLFGGIVAGQLVLSLGLILALLQVRVTRPIQRLMRDSERLARRSLAEPFVWKRADEIGSLGRSLEETRKALRALFQELEDKNLRLERDIQNQTRLTVQLQRQRDDLEQVVAIRTDELLAAKMRAETASHAKSAFLANMSHELRTPLNAILGYTQMLRREGNLSRRQADGLSIVEQSGAHLLALINDVLDLSKIEAGRLELDPGVVHLESFLALVADIVRVKAEQKGLRFAFEPAPGLPRAVRADESRLRQVLLNLLANAVLYTDKGDVTLRASAAPADAGEVRLRFEVEDTGIGISEDQTTTIFLPFEQGGVKHRHHGGTGLGLAISRQLVRLMGSDIGLRSAPDRGSLFWFEIAVPLAEAESARAPAGVVVTGYLGPRKHALVADDVPANCSMMVDFLSLLGFTVDAAGNGRLALEIAAAHPPDLVVMDIVMPEMDGIEATRRMRAIPALGATRIVCVSASTSETDERRALQVGADAFLPKPVDLDRFVREVGDLLGLAWVHERAPGTGTANGAGPLMAPPPAELETLHHLARVGSMKDIREKAAHIATLDERYRPVAERLRALADMYQSKAILELVESMMKAQ